MVLQASPFVAAAGTKVPALREDVHVVPRKVWRSCWLRDLSECCHHWGLGYGVCTVNATLIRPIVAMSLLRSAAQMM